MHITLCLLVTFSSNWVLKVARCSALARRLLGHQLSHILTSIKRVSKNTELRNRQCRRISFHILYSGFPIVNQCDLIFSCRVEVRLCKCRRHSVSSCNCTGLKSPHVNENPCLTEKHPFNSFTIDDLRLWGVLCGAVLEHEPISELLRTHGAEQRDNMQHANWVSLATPDQWCFLDSLLCEGCWKWCNDPRWVLCWVITVPDFDKTAFSILRRLSATTHLVPHEVI